MSQRCCLSVSVVPFDKQSAKNKNKSKAKSKINNPSIQLTKQAESETDTADDVPYTKDTQKLIETKQEAKSQESLDKPDMRKSLSKNLNEIINSVSSVSSSHGIRSECEHAVQHPIETSLIDYANTIHTPSSSCSSAVSLCKPQEAQRRSSVTSESKKQAPNEFNLRINQLRFIDESASSTAVTSPMGSTSHLYWPKRPPQQQHKLLSSSSTSSSRTISLPASSSCSQTSSGQSTPKQQLKQQPKQKRTLSIQRQANVQSSTETLCSESSQLQRQHELLGAHYLADVKANKHSTSEQDDDEIVNIISHNNNQPPPAHLPIPNRTGVSLKNFDDSYSEDDSYYSHLYAENKKLLEKTKTEKILSKQNKVNNDSDSSSVCSSSNINYKKTYRSHHKYAKQFYSFPSSVRTSLNGHSDDRIYAYDNFDCINECIEEPDQLNDNDEEEETSNLVEDGFIRMSSPVDSVINHSNTNTNLDSTGLDSTTDLNDIEICNIAFSNVANFPNVGSSPISDELLNTSSDADGETFNENAEASCDYGGIIIHNSTDSNTNEITSLSDENDELNDEQDDFGFESFDKSQIKYLTSQTKAPHSIMKSKTSCLKQAEVVVNEVSSNSEGAEKDNNNQANIAQRPKVRFNLDIDYEKEREWNRINKIIGDASKTQIEWTQEVEV